MEISDDMEIYIIRAENPLDMEGAAHVTAVFFDKDVAEETVERLKVEEEAANRETWGERWRSFAVYYTVEARPVMTSVEGALEHLKEQE